MEAARKYAADVAERKRLGAEGVLPELSDCDTDSEDPDSVPLKVARPSAKRITDVRAQIGRIRSSPSPLSDAERSTLSTLEHTLTGMVDNLSVKAFAAARLASALSPLSSPPMSPPPLPAVLSPPASPDVVIPVVAVAPPASPVSVASPAAADSESVDIKTRPSPPIQDISLPSATAPNPPASRVAVIGAKRTRSSSDPYEQRVKSINRKDLTVEALKIAIRNRHRRHQHQQQQREYLVKQTIVSHPDGTVVITRTLARGSKRLRC